MNLDLDTRSTQELKDGYFFDSASQSYQCILCQAAFTVGEVYPLGGKYYDAAHAVKQHMASSHPDHFQTLLQWDSKYVSLTENQKELLSLFQAGLADNEIARHMGISPSTVRHQKFMFREKAKQAKMYLCLYELAQLQKGAPADTIVPVPAHATMVDDRFVITESERDKILSGVFASLSPLKLKRFPPKEKKKVVILTEIARQFERDRRYSEKEVNHILQEIYEDYVTLRRYLIEYGFMDRTRDCSEYWMK